MNLPLQCVCGPRFQMQFMKDMYFFLFFLQKKEDGSLLLKFE